MKRLKIKINFSNRWLYTFIILGIIAIVGVGVYAYGTTTPSTLGHTWGEMVCDSNFCISSNGNVGIKTASPGIPLDVVGRIRSQGTSAGIWVGDNMFVGELTADNMGFYTGSNWRMVLTNSGNVGIGTTNPQSKLSVGGEGNAAWGIYSNGGSGYGVYGYGLNNGVRGEGGLYGLYGYGTQAGVRASGVSYAGYMSGKFYVTGTCSGSSSCDQDIAEKWVSEKALEHIHCEEDRFNYLDEEINQDMKEDYQYTCVLDSGFESEFENGDVVCFESAMDSVTIIKFCEKAYDKKALSTISYNATIKFGPEYYPYPVALAGNIPIKVICDNPIKAGDSLVTSDIPGYAMKLEIPQDLNLEEYDERRSAVFAKALEPCDSGRKIIRAWI